MRDKRNPEECYGAGLSALVEIGKIFPNLTIKINEEDPNVDIMMDIPKQQGLDFDINLNLQNIDELHLSVDKLWMCWFPCTVEENKAGFIDTVTGLITGKYRILETLRGESIVKAELQFQENGEWISISSGQYIFQLPKFGKKSHRIKQNQYHE